MCGTPNFTALAVSMQRIILLFASATAFFAWTMLCEKINQAKFFKPGIAPKNSLEVLKA